VRYRLLGRTGLYVSEISLGTVTFGGGGAWEAIGALKEPAVVEQLRVAFEAGVNLIDTADVYSLGESERLVGKAIRALGLPRQELIIATKATAIMSESPNSRGQSRHHLFNSVEGSLKRLQLDYIDLYQLHGFDPLTPLDEALGALNDLVRSGKVRYVGLSNLAAWQIMKALAISERRGWSRCESVQAYYSIAGRDLEREVLPLVADQQVGVLVWSPLAGGLLTGKYKAGEKSPSEFRRTHSDFPVVDKARAFSCIETMRRIAARTQRSIAQVSLAWLLSKPLVTSVIVGARTVEQLRENLTASELRLGSEDLTALDEVSRLPQEYPGWILDFFSTYRATAPAMQ
jgi:aryl-alcohol dehydrogenase-like predicted oxidoreductase